MENIKIGNSYAYLVPYLQSIQYKEKMPTVIVCPGGAYFYTSQRETEPVAIEFLSRGYNVFVLHYSTMATKLMVEEGVDYETARLNIEDDVLQSQEQPSQFPIPLVELSLAMKHIHEHANEYHVDVDNIITCGFSAGANLVSLLGVYWNTDWLNDLVGTTQEILKPKAQILGYGYMDSLKLYEANFNNMNDAEEAILRAVFNDIELDEEDFKSVSPTLLAHDQVPPSFVWHTREDGLVPVEQSLNFCLALQDKNVPWELHVFDRGDHGLSIATDSSFSRNDHAHAWINLADSWLKKYYIEGAKQ